MDAIIFSVFMCLLLAVALSFTRFRGKAPRKLPPGPYPLPIIGNIHKLGKHPHKSLSKLAQVYGPIMRLKLGHVTTIVISSSSTAQQVLQKQDLAFSGRPVLDAVRVCNHFEKSVVWLSVGSRWRSLRRIMSSYIFIANKLDANQHLRNKKVHELIKYCEKSSQSGEAVDIGRAAFLTSLNLLSNTMFSKDMIDPYQNSEEGKKLRELVWNIMVEAGKPNLVDYFPILRWIDPQGINRRLTGHIRKLLKLFDGLINERLELKRSGNSGENGTTDVLDQLLTLLQTNEIDKYQIQHLFVDLFVAGTDTTSSGIAPEELDMEDKFGITLAKLHPLRAVPTLVVP
ncbi:Geraniol 8-hydroxylase [Heracleum sosnowskyi]|uniref:Geraniol 8-hydroxylase n=1 Tax=Heracleum sosnowskyi TaxID=360622 RepID=A0AAD8J499_9APIA|nr:Geraniol 8-hydroxylase [Heracleum sosnowskyi]